MERWVKASKHGLTGNEPEILLDHLRAIAWASSVGKEEDGNLTKCHHYDKAVTVLKSTNLCRNNSKVRQWLINNWLNIPEVCMHALCCVCIAGMYVEHLHSMTILCVHMYVLCILCTLCVNVHTADTLRIRPTWLHLCMH